MVLLRLACLACGLLGLAGCGPDAIRLVKAAGIVTLDGEPVAGGSLQFLPDETSGTTGPMSYGTIQPDGRFEMFGPDGQPGVVPGKHRVAIQCPQPGSGASDGPGVVVGPCRIPARYATPDSGLVVEVAADSDSLEIKLLSGG